MTRMDKETALKVLSEAGIVVEKISAADYEELLRLKRREHRGDYSKYELAGMADRLGIGWMAERLISNDKYCLLAERLPGTNILFCIGPSTTRYRSVFSDSVYWKLASDEFSTGEEFTSALREFFMSKEFDELVKKVSDEWKLGTPDASTIEEARKKCLSMIPDSAKVDEFNARNRRISAGIEQRRAAYADKKKTLNIEPEAGDWVLSSKVKNGTWARVVSRNGDNLVVKVGSRTYNITRDDVDDVQTWNLDKVVDKDASLMRGERTKAKDLAAYRAAHVDET